MQEPSSTALQRCVELCRGALHGRTPAPPSTAASLRLASIYHSSLYRWLFTLLCAAWLTLPYVEPPFRSPASTFPMPALRALDASFLALALLDVLLLQRAAYGQAWLSRGWVRAKLAALLALREVRYALAAVSQLRQWHGGLVELTDGYQRLTSQYLYFCTSKVRKFGT